VIRASAALPWFRQQAELILAFGVKGARSSDLDTQCIEKKHKRDVSRQMVLA
jgi:hypothetical protein